MQKRKGSGASRSFARLRLSNAWYPVKIATFKSGEETCVCSYFAAFGTDFSDCDLSSVA